MLPFDTFGYTTRSLADRLTAREDAGYWLALALWHSNTLSRHCFFCTHQQKTPCPPSRRQRLISRWVTLVGFLLTPQFQHMYVESRRFGGGLMVEDEFDQEH